MTTSGFTIHPPNLFVLQALGGLLAVGS